MMCVHVDACADDVCACGRCVDDMHMSPVVVLHEIGQLRQIFAWVLAINLTITTEGLVNQTRESHLENIKKKKSATALHKAHWLTC